MIVTAHVTDEDIYNGSPGNACWCPVWLAIARALPWLRNLSERFTVGPLGLCFGGNAIPLPPIVHEFWPRFDEHLPVSPFRFTFEMPDALVAAEAWAA